MREIPLVVSLDTEEDNWNRSRTDVTVENIGELRRQARFFESLGVRPTYFTSYHVAIDPCAAAVMCDIGGEGRAEIGAHLHPWNTPPLTEAFVPRNSMVKNLPADLQRAKIRTLTEAMQQAFGQRPTAFRAGRYGIGPDTVAALVSCGYRVPLSYGFSRGPFSVFEPVQRLLEAAPPSLHLPGIAVRTGLVRRLSLSPEFQSVAQMLTLSARLLEHGARHLHISWHTPSLKPGLSPFTRTTADVERLFATIEGYLEKLANLTPFRFVTVNEAAAVLMEAPAC